MHKTPDLISAVLKGRASQEKPTGTLLVGNRATILGPITCMVLCNIMMTEKDKTNCDQKKKHMFVPISPGRCIIPSPHAPRQGRRNPNGDLRVL